MQNKPLSILQIDASARLENSYSRQLTTRLISKFKDVYGEVQLKERTISQLPFLSATMVEAMFLSEDKRTEEQRASLKISDELIEELKTSDIIVIGVPIYNFSIPSHLKAYIDLITRAGVTFKFTPNGPLGLIKHLKAYIIVVSGGTEMHGDGDFVTDYMKFVLRFIGITDVYLINATAIRHKGEKIVLADAMNQIQHLLSAKQVA